MKESILACLICFMTMTAFGQKANIGAFQALDNASIYWTDEKPSLRASNLYSTKSDFKETSTQKRVMKRKIFRETYIILDYSYKQNDLGQKEFTEVNVHYTDLCENCELRVKFSRDQYKADDSSKAYDSLILMSFTLVKGTHGKRTSSEVVGTLSTDGEFQLKKGDV